MFNVINWPDIVALLEEFDLSRYISILLISFKKCIHGFVERIRNAFIWTQKKNCWWKRKQCKWKIPLSFSINNLHGMYILGYVKNQSVSSVAQSCPTLCNPRDYRMPGFPVNHQLPELTQTHVHWVSDAIQPSHPLPLSLFPSIRLFANESALHIRWPKYWRFSFSISPSNE